MKKKTIFDGEKMDVKSVADVCKNNNKPIIYYKKNVMILKITNVNQIKAIGCNSLWCFTYGDAYYNALEMWEGYSHNNIVYVIINFNYESDDSNFMHVFINSITDEEGNVNDDADLSYILFDMSNYPIDEEELFVKFEEIFGDNYMKIITKYMNFSDKELPKYQFESVCHHRFQPKIRF